MAPLNHSTNRPQTGQAPSTAASISIINTTPTLSTCPSLDTLTPKFANIDARILARPSIHPLAGIAPPTAPSNISPRSRKHSPYSARPRTNSHEKFSDPYCGTLGKFSPQYMSLSATLPPPRPMAPRAPPQLSDSSSTTVLRTRMSSSGIMPVA